MTENTLTIGSRLGDYPVKFQPDFRFLADLATRPNPVLLVDANVLRLYETHLREAFGDRPVYALEAIEARKTLDETSRVCQWILDTFNAKRNIDFISIGGGITQDVSGFVASTLFRGIGWDFVPTTLLAQCDSCIGGKTSINFGSRKNLLGTFYPPRAIHLCPAFTRTLTRLDLFSGYGEIAKFLLMRAFESGLPVQSVSEKFALVLRQDSDDALSKIIHECLDIKNAFMKDDEFDRGRRNLLNYGHCFGHALEAASDYFVPHGIAVNIGIIFANIVAASRGLISQETCEHITRTVNIPLLAQPQRPTDYEAAPLLANLKNDKKRTGAGLPLVVPVANGLVKLDDFSETEFRHALDALRAILFSTNTSLKETP